MKKLVLVLALLGSNGAVAQGLDQKTIRAFNNLQEEMTTCMAYYMFGQACMKDQMTPETTQRAAAAFNALNESSFEIGQSLGMTVDAMISRLEMSAGEMRRLTNNSCINFSS
jgi:hypothetical protein